MPVSGGCSCTGFTRTPTRFRQSIERGHAEGRAGSVNRTKLRLQGALRTSCLGGRHCLNKTLALPSIEAIKRCASAGMGVAVLPRIAVEKELAQQQLVSLSWPKDTIRVYSQMIRHSEKWQSSAHVAFWQLAKHMMTTDDVSHKVPLSATLQVKSVSRSQLQSCISFTQWRSAPASGL